MKKEIVSRFLLSLVVNIAISCIAIFVFGLYLYQDDDTIMSWVSYGIISEPSSRLYCVNVILGWVYKHLFMLIPEFNWQTLIFCLGIVFSGTIGFYSVLKRHSRILTILWLLFELVFFNDVYVYLTFSVVSAFVAYQGYLALFLSLKEEKTSVFLYVTSGLAIVFSSLIRIDSFLGASGFAFFLWVIFVVLEHKDGIEKKTFLRKYVYLFVVIIGTSLLLFGLDRATYSKGVWKEFKEYADVRSILTDHRNSVSLMKFEELEEVGINASMGRAVAEWRNNDPEVLSIENLKIMESTGEKYAYRSSSYVLREFFYQFIVMGKSFWEIYFSVFAFFFLIYVVWKKNDPIEKRLSLMVIIPFLAEFFYFAFIGRTDGGTYPYRCIYIVLMGLSISSMVVYGTLVKADKLDTTMGRVLLCVLIVSALIVQPKKDFRIKGLGLVDTDALEKEYGFLGRDEKIYVLEYDARKMIERAYGPWQTPPAGFMKHSIELGSWFTNHPKEIEHRVALGCENPYRALYENENVYYIRKFATEEFVLEYLKENYDDRISYEYIKEKGDFKVFKYSLDN